MLWINGTPGKQLMLPHRGLSYGDGLFETLHVRNGQAPLLERHLNRLSAGADHLQFPDDTRKKLISETDEFAKRLATRQSTGIWKLMLVRNGQGRGYGIPKIQCCDLIQEFHEDSGLSPGWNESGLNVGICQTSITINADLAGLKHLNRLDSVLASAEIQSKGWDEGLMVNGSSVIETSKSNIFLITGSCLKTPAIKVAGVKGVARGLILEAAQNCFEKIEVGEVSIEELAEAEFIFVSNAVIIARPVGRLMLASSGQEQSESFADSHPYYQKLVLELVRKTGL